MSGNSDQAYEEFAESARGALLPLPGRGKSFSDSKSPGIETATSSVRSVWTTEDQARLDELQARRDSIMNERQAVILELIGTSGLNCLDEMGAVNVLITNAEAFRDALLPFDGRRGQR